MSAVTDRVDLIENRDYGRCSIIKALKAVLDRVDVENTIYTKIGYPLRQEREMIDSVAMREAVINAVVHNDYSYGATPKIEFFSDRVEVTSMGGLPYGVPEKEFFGGYSVPRILKAYGKDAFEIRTNYLRIVFHYAKPIFDTEQATPPNGSARVTARVTISCHTHVKAGAKSRWKIRFGATTGT